MFYVMIDYRHILVTVVCYFAYTMIYGLQRESQKKMIVFTSTQDGVEFLYRLVQYLSKNHSADSDVEEGEPTTSLDVYRLHGDMSQQVGHLYSWMLKAFIPRHYLTFGLGFIRVSLSFTQSFYWFLHIPEDGEIMSYHILMYID